MSGVDFRSVVRDRFGPGHVAVRRGISLGFRVLLLCLCVSWTALAAEGLDEDLMYDIDDLHADIKTVLANKDAAHAPVDAKKIRELFVAVERYYVKTGGADDAVGFARKGQSLSEEIAVGAAAGNWPQALKAYQDLSGTCKSCHARYKP